MTTTKEAAAAAAATPGWLTGGVGAPGGSASLVNFFRLADAAHRLSVHVQAGSRRDNKEFANCCIDLANCIDFAIGFNEVPVKPQELPSLLKQVCQCQCRNSTAAVKAAIMVLMVSVKNACQLGWFTQEESQELLALVDEISKCFCGLGDVSASLTSPSVTGPGDLFSQILERFYPFVKLGHVVASIEAKPGFAMLVTDFHVSAEMPRSSHEKVRLFVVQKDNIGTSACITNPPQVSFLLNGMGVERRTNVSMDSGPQLPTDVHRMLRYGTNLLQAMGHFNGHYIIVLAFTRVIPPTDVPLLEDYVQSGIVESSSDSDVIEGPSRISLNCPISRTRIKLPVKGHLCKHLQCFDFWNFFNINMRRPSWRCPHCNQPVSYTDIRVDQNMVKVLKEVGYDATDLIISTDGSWRVVMENDDNMEPVQEAEDDREDPTRFLNAGPSVWDLTGDDDEMNTFGDTGVEDQKPLCSDLHHQSTATNSSRSSNRGNNAAPTVGLSSAFRFPNSQTPDSTIPNLFSPPSNTVPQLAQTLSATIGQEYINLSQTQAMQFIPVPSLQTPSPQDRPTGTATTFNQSIPTAQLSQFQAPPVTPLVNCMGRTASLLERWHQMFQISRASQNPSQPPGSSSSQNFPAILSWNHPTGSQSPVQSMPPPPPPPRPSPQPSMAAQQNRLVNGDHAATSQVASQQRLNNPGGGTNWRPQGRMRGSLMPGSYSSDLDHLIIRPTQQSQTIGPPTSQPVQTPPAQLAQPSAPCQPVQLANQTHPMNVHPTQASSSLLGPRPSFAGPSRPMRTHQMNVPQTQASSLLLDPPPGFAGPSRPMPLQNLGRR